MFFTKAIKGVNNKHVLISRDRLQQLSLENVKEHGYFGVLVSGYEVRYGFCNLGQSVVGEHNGTGPNRFWVWENAEDELDSN